MCLAAHTEFDFKQMLTAPPASPGETGAVDPYWDPLNPEHGLPRNLVFVITNSDRSTRALPLALHSVNRINCIIPALELQ